MTWWGRRYLTRVREQSVIQDDRFASVSFIDQKIEKRKITLSLIITCTDGDEVKIEGVEVDV